jgi:hypothetical protein
VALPASRRVEEGGSVASMCRPSAAGEADDAARKRWIASPIPPPWQGANGKRPPPSAPARHHLALAGGPSDRRHSRVGGGAKDPRGPYKLTIRRKAKPGCPCSERYRSRQFASRTGLNFSTACQTHPARPPEPQRRAKAPGMTSASGGRRSKSGRLWATSPAGGDRGREPLGQHSGLRPSRPSNNTWRPPRG